MFIYEQNFVSNANNFWLKNSLRQLLYAAGL